MAGLKTLLHRLLHRDGRRVRRSARHARSPRELHSRVDDRRSKDEAKFFPMSW